MNKSTFVIGGLLIFFGLFFLTQSLNLIWIDLGDLISFMVPFGLIGFGIWLIIRKKDKESKTISVSIHTDSGTSDFSAPEPKESENAADTGPAPFPPAEPVSPIPPISAKTPADSFRADTHESGESDTSGKLRYSKFLGDMHVDCKGQSLNNVEISLGIGDLELNLKDGILSKGLNRVIISGFIGDIRIFVPEKMSFFSHCSNFIGDIDLAGQRTSGFGNTLEHNTPDYDKADSKLYVAANNFIGDIKVYHI